MNFETVAVDTSGNISAASGRKFLETAAAGVDPGNEILERTCGIWCADATTPATHPKGYYTCRAAGICCVGPGCTAAN